MKIQQFSPWLGYTDTLSFVEGPLPQCSQGQFVSLVISSLCRMIIVGQKELSSVLGVPAISRTVKNHKTSENEGALASSSPALWFYRLRNQESGACSPLSPLTWSMTNPQQLLWLPNPGPVSFLPSQTISCYWPSSGIKFRSMWEH